jgi:RNA polymerase sigma factor (sigma-70 family)
LTDLEPAWGTLIHDCFEHPQSKATLARFFEAIIPYLRAALTSYHYGDPTLVEDAIQSAFVKFMKMFRESPRRPLRIGYFVVIARNCLIDELRGRKGHLSIDDLAESELAAAKVPALRDPDHRLTLIQHAMARLDSRCQFILESYYVNEMDSKDLAEMLNVSPDSVHMAIKRCRDRLRMAIADLTRSLSETMASKSG